jgi:hypothetical protein
MTNPVSNVSQIAVKNVYKHVDGFVDGASTVNIIDPIPLLPVDLFGKIYVNVSCATTGVASVAILTISVGSGGITLDLDSNGGIDVYALVVGGGGSIEEDSVTIFYEPPSAGNSAAIEIGNNLGLDIYVSAVSMLETIDLS